MAGTVAGGKNGRGHKFAHGKITAREAGRLGGMVTKPKLTKLPMDGDLG